MKFGGGWAVPFATMASLLALLSSLLWGTADFEGGRLSKKHAPIAVLGASQVLGLVLGYHSLSSLVIGMPRLLVPMASSFQEFSQAFSVTLD